MFTQEQLHRLTMGEWNDIYYEYRQLYNFEAKTCLYEDIEEEIRALRNEKMMESMKSRPVASIRDL